MTDGWEPVGERGRAKAAIEVLNRIHELDPTVLPALIRHRTRCNQALADDPTVQVGPRTVGHEYQPTHPTMGCNLCGREPGSDAHVVREEGYEVGILGIINGIFGTNGDGKGWIAARMNADGSLYGFVFDPTEGEQQ